MRRQLLHLVNNAFNRGGGWDGSSVEVGGTSLSEVETALNGSLTLDKSFHLGGVVEICPTFVFVLDDVQYSGTLL